MKAALLYDIGDLRVVDIPKPEPTPDEVLVRVTVCAVCPTDIRKYRVGNHGVLKFPFNLGHEWVGEVIEVGDRVHDVAVGTRVVGGGYAGYAEYAPLGGQVLRITDNHPLIIPDHVSDEEATFVEPLADCIHAVMDQARVRLGDTVLILGAGQMALQQVMIAKAVGATVIVSEPIAERRAHAKQFGADHVVDGAEDVVTQVKELTEGRGADAAIVTIGAPPAMLTAIDAVRAQARVVLFGGFDRGVTVTLDPNTIHYKELEVVGSEWIGLPPRANFGLYELALRLIAQRKIPVADLITHRMPLGQIQEAFDAILSRTGLKAMIHVNGHVHGNDAEI